MEPSPTRARAQNGSLPIIRVKTEATRPGRPGEKPVGGNLPIRKYEVAKERKKRAAYTVLALIIAFMTFPLIPAYFIAWLLWANRPKQKSKRLVRKSVRSLIDGKTGIAVKDLQEAHLLDPHNTDALYWLGLVLAEQGRHEDARDALNVVHERTSTIPEVEAALLESCFATGRYDEAILHAQRLLNLEPGNLDALLMLANAFEATGDVDAAIETLQHAPLYMQTLNDQLKQILYRLAELHERRGDHETALKHFLRLYTTDVTFRDVHQRVEALKASE